MRPIGDHFFTTSEGERDNAIANVGYLSEGIACWVPSVPQQVGRVPFYRLFRDENGDHFYTTSAAERDNAIASFGYVFEGVAADVFAGPEQNTVPLHRLFHPGNGDHFYTTSGPERDNAVTTFGYVSEGVAAWVPTGPGTVPLFRLLNPLSGDHFYTTSAGERDTAIQAGGYFSEGTACNVFTPQASSSTPLYRLYNSQSGDHFYTTSASERASAIAQAGYVAEGVACDIRASAAPDTTPLYRLFLPSSGDHFYTTSAAERDNAIASIGYQAEGIAGHVYAASGVDRTPLYRLFKQFGAGFDVNLILVGTENFTTALRTQLDQSLTGAQAIFTEVGLQMRNFSWFHIDVADAGTYANLDKSEAPSLTADWTVPNHALDLFIAPMMTGGADGRSAVNGSCNKDAKGMTGSVVSLNGNAANSGNTFAHEMGHYLGLDHIADPNNFIGNNGASDSNTEILASQGQTMAKHCFVYDL
jgi:hypothetical protein